MVYFYYHDLWVPSRLSLINTVLADPTSLPSRQSVAVKFDKITGGRTFNVPLYESTNVYFTF